MFLFKMHSIGSVRPVPRAAALINANANANPNANWWNRRTQGPSQGQELNPTPDPQKQEPEKQKPEKQESVPTPGEDVVVIQEEEMVLIHKNVEGEAAPQPEPECTEPECTEPECTEPGDAAPEPECTEPECTVSAPPAKAKPKRKQNKRK